MAAPRAAGRRTPVQRGRPDPSGGDTPRPAGVAARPSRAAAAALRVRRGGVVAAHRGRSGAGARNQHQGGRRGEIRSADRDVRARALDPRLRRDRAGGRPAGDDRRGRQDRAGVRLHAGGPRAGLHPAAGRRPGRATASMDFGSPPTSSGRRRPARRQGAGDHRPEPVLHDALPRQRGRSASADCDGDGVNDRWPLFYDNYFVPRGYAYVLAQMNGTGNSTDGCPDARGARRRRRGMKSVIDWLDASRRRAYHEQKSTLPDPRLRRRGAKASRRR